MVLSLLQGWESSKGLSPAAMSAPWILRRCAGSRGLCWATGNPVQGPAHEGLHLCERWSRKWLIGGTCGCCRAAKQHQEPYRYEHITPPKAVDWRAKGIVGPIKDQHVNGSTCGCCWTFATTGVAECVIAMATGKVIALSEQQLIDCDRAGVRPACCHCASEGPLPCLNACI
jgi:hypothetical protein